MKVAGTSRGFNPVNTVRPYPARIAMVRLKNAISTQAVCSEQITKRSTTSLTALPADLPNVTAQACAVTPSYPASSKQGNQAEADEAAQPKYFIFRILSDRHLDSIASQGA